MAEKEREPIHAYCVPCGKRTDHPRARAVDGCWCSECGCLKTIDVLLTIDQLYPQSQEEG